MANVSPTVVSPADQLANLRLDDATDGGKADDAKAVKLTPAGGQINVSWGESTDAIRCLATFLSKAVDVNDDWHVVFRCGTVVRVSPTDKEFGGFDDGEYEWPEHRSEQTDTVSDVMNDNKLVWSNQRKIPGPAGTAIRQGPHRARASQQWQVVQVLQQVAPCFFRVGTVKLNVVRGLHPLNHAIRRASFS